jgi:protocatechuate 3,4-dioxygenase beta subunit
MIAILLVVSALQALPQRDARPAPGGAMGTIAGTVTSAGAQPRPLRRVRVTLDGPGLTLPLTVVTADDGSFVFERVPAGRFMVTATKDGYLSMSYGASRTGRPGTRVQVAGGQSVPLALRLPRGAVITGTVTDADGLPAQGIAVTALTGRFVAPQGERRHVAAGVSVGPTDDRGVYRIFGLPEGEYVVAAQSQTRQFGLAASEVRTLSDGALSERSLVMAQVFHPGVTTVANATRVTLRTGEERSGIDVSLQYVPLASVSGTIAISAGRVPAVVSLARTDEVPGFEPIRTARADTDGRFTFTSVPPGQYRVMARSTLASPLPTSGSPLTELPGNQQYAFADVIVAGEDVTSLALTAQPGLTVSGRILFEGQQPPAALPGRLTLPAASITATAFGVPPISVEGTRFKVEGLMPGSYRIVGVMQGVRSPIGLWWLKSLVIAGRDVLDAPLEIRQSTDDAVITFADRASEIAGSVNDTQGAPATEPIVIAFSTDRATWFFNSRRVAVARPDREGRYAIRNLPPGEYCIVATTDAENGEWFDPALLERLLPLAAPLTVNGTEKQTMDLTVR